MIDSICWWDQLLQDDLGVLERDRRMETWAYLNYAGARFESIACPYLGPPRILKPFE